MISSYCIIFLLKNSEHVFNFMPQLTRINYYTVILKSVMQYFQKRPKLRNEKLVLKLNVKVQEFPYMNVFHLWERLQKFHQRNPTQVWHEIKAISFLHLSLMGFFNTFYMWFIYINSHKSFLFLIFFFKV